MNNKYFKEMREDVVFRKRVLSVGEMKALNAWIESIEDGQEDVILTEYLDNEKETKEFISTLRKAGIGKFIYANNTMRVMDGMKMVERTGCEIIGSVIINTVNLRHQNVEVYGICFKLT